MERPPVLAPAAPTGVRAPATACLTAPAALRGLWRAALLAALLAFAGLPAQAQDAPAKFAGTYRIEGWRALEAQGLHHFFYLQADGHFLLAAQWPGHETSQFVGTWRETDGALELAGRGHVDTNEGNWRTEFRRRYRIEVAAGGIVLRPEPVKNRFGMMGWPQAYTFYRPQPAPNLPGVKLPEDPAAMAKTIAAALAKQRP